MSKAKLKKRESVFAFLKKDFQRNKIIYLMLLPVVAYFVIFHYLPMYGASISFKQYDIVKGIGGSKWVGFKHFIRFFNSPLFSRVTFNTFIINSYMLIFGFPAPIILALMLNEVKSRIFKRTVQTISYLPHFISIVVISGIIIQFTAKDGLINDILEFLNMERISMLIQPKMFRPIYVITGIWQEIGWESIIYLSALSAINQELYEAARIDGAGRWRQIISVTIPGIMPTIVIMIIMRIGSMMNVGYEKIILLTNQNTYETGEVISSYVYRTTLVNLSSYDYGTAIGLFNSVINLTLLVFANYISKAVSETSLW